MHSIIDRRAVYRAKLDNVRFLRKSGLRTNGLYARSFPRVGVCPAAEDKQRRYNVLTHAYLRRKTEGKGE